MSLSHVTFVPVDFVRQRLGDVMDRAGFRDGAETFVVWEGVTQYIGRNAVDATFRHLYRSVAPGSRIVFTYVHGGLIDGSTTVDGAEKLLAEVERRGEPWVFGIHPAELPRYLATLGSNLVEDVGAEDYRIRYLKPTRRSMNLFEGERVAVASVG